MDREYEDSNGDWTKLEPELFKYLVECAVEKVFQTNASLKRRMDNLVSKAGIHQKLEKKWCLEVVGRWYSRQWKNRISESKARAKRTAEEADLDDNKACPECLTNMILVCPCCHDLKSMVCSLPALCSELQFNKRIKLDDKQIDNEWLIEDTEPPSNNDEASEQDEDDNPDEILTDREPTPTVTAEAEKVTEEYFGGTPFEKLDLYYSKLKVKNPWHPHFAIKLTPGQVIGFYWMAGRFEDGGGVVADKVGLGKVCSPSCAMLLARILTLLIFVETFMAVCFIYWLKLQISGSSPPFNLPFKPRNLCLLVLNNVSLVDGWVNTLNNDCKPRRAFWTDSHGLRYLDLTTPRPKIPDAKDGVFEDIDVVMIKSSWLSMQNCWPLRFHWHTVIADEVHDFLRGDHTAKDKSAPSTTLKNWYRLLHQTSSTYVITGTPFYTKISWDFKQITKAAGVNQVREKWGEYASDDGLEKLFEEWSEDIKDPQKDIAVYEKQQAQFKRAAESFAQYTIRRDKKSMIDGKPVIEDYLGQCVRHIEPLTADPKEQDKQATLYKKHYGGIRTDANRNHTMRCLTWCHRYVFWAENRGANKEWWDDFTLEEAQECLRTRVLVDKIVEGTKAKAGVVLFCQTHFHIQLCMKVIPYPLFLLFPVTS